MQIKDSLFKLKSPFETRLQRDPCSRAHVQQPRPCRRSSWATRTLINQRTDDGHTDRPSHNRMHDARPSPAGAPPALVEGRRPQKVWSLPNSPVQRGGIAGSTRGGRLGRRALVMGAVSVPGLQLDGGLVRT